MKKALFIILACTFLLNISNLCTAGETFTLMAPKTISPQATGGEIISYTIVPGPEPRFAINFRWTDSDGNYIGVPEAVTWTGQHFQDIFGFVIRTQDVGVTIGVGLRTLIHNKIEDMCGCTIE